MLFPPETILDPRCKVVKNTRKASRFVPKGVTCQGGCCSAEAVGLELVEVVVWIDGFGKGVAGGFGGHFEVEFFAFNPELRLLFGEGDVFDVFGDAPEVGEVVVEDHAGEGRGLFFFEALEVGLLGGDGADAEGFVEFEQFLCDVLKVGGFGIERFDGFGEQGFGGLVDGEPVFDGGGEEACGILSALACGNFAEVFDVVADAFEVRHAAVDVFDEDGLATGEVVVGELGGVVAHGDFDGVNALLVDADEALTFGVVADEFFGGKVEAFGADAAGALHFA